MRKKFLILSIVFLLFLTLSYTYSAFNSAIVGNISGNIKDWVFKVSIDNSTTYNDSYKLHLSGTSGSFNVNINTVGGTKGADYSIELIGDSSIKYYTDSGYTNLISNNIYKGSINSNSNNSVTIYYKSSSNINSDILIKTKAIIKEISYAMMKNGYSSDSSVNGGTEFWNYSYKPFIRTIEFGNDLSNMPTSCTSTNLCWDVSYAANQENKVYAYLTDSGYKDSIYTSQKLYNLYIVSESVILAPYECYKIFSFYKYEQDPDNYENDKDLANLININFNNNFDTSKVTDMRAMFSSNLILSSLNLSSFDTSNVTNMYMMFISCKNLTNLNLSSFNTAKVANMSYMFNNCSSLITLNLSNFDTSNVGNMSFMFAQCSSLATPILSSFETSKVTNMASMFGSCSSLTTLNLSDFDTSNVRHVMGMFSGCIKLQTEINIMNSDITEYNYYRYMFNGAATASGAKITVNYITSASSSVSNMIATKSSGSNVVKGNILSEYSIDISGNDDIKYVSYGRAKGTKIELISTSGNNLVTSFKMNGTTVNGNEFTMPGSNVTITDIVTISCKTIETAHYPYLNSQSNVVVGEYTFENAKSLTIILDYETQSSYDSNYAYLYSDYFYIYDSSTATSGINNNKKYGAVRTHETITINSNYIKITFTSNSSSNNFYGIRAIIIPNY